MIAVFDPLGMGKVRSGFSVGFELAAILGGRGSMRNLVVSTARFGLRAWV